MADVMSDPAVAVSFTVTIDRVDLGTFTSCEGLGCEVVIEQREEGGNQFFVHQLPGRIKYSNVKLTRPINSDTGKVAEWFASMAAPGARMGAQIVAKTHDGVAVARWGLLEVIPVKWTGPQLGVDNLKVATETLEIAHHGFVAPAGKGD